MSIRMWRISLCFLLSVIESENTILEKIEFDVHMNVGVLYDYSLYHTYRSMAGILGTFVGILLIANFARFKNPLYLIFGIVCILYLPVALYMSCRKQMLSVEAYKQPLHYKLTDEGIEVSQGDIVQGHGWDAVIKAVSTGKSIMLYTGKNVATIFPRADLGDDTADVIKYICAHVEPKKVKIRF